MRFNILKDIKCVDEIFQIQSTPMKHSNSNAMFVVPPDISVLKNISRIGDSGIDQTTLNDQCCRYI